MSLLDILAEQRLAAAAARGEFDNLPGAGMPQQWEDDLLVPEEVRMMNRILKNAGALPPLLEAWRELKAAARAGEGGDGADHQEEGCRQREEVPQQQEDAPCLREEARRLRLRILALDMSLEALRGSPAIVPQEYRQALFERLAGQEARKERQPAVHR
jgi:hypothetical protein